VQTNQEDAFGILGAEGMPNSVEEDLAVLAKDQFLWSPVDPKEYCQDELKRIYDGDCGYDLETSRVVTVPAHGFATIPTNVKIHLPQGCWALLAGRSSTFSKKHLFTNPGFIDWGWRGELLATVYNPTDQPCVIKKGDRFIQLVVFNLVIPQAYKVAADDLPPGDRGERGFGSTGEGAVSAR
jgi:deoxyuridine 5'-triphosphate nucleotidohydrolase